MVAAEALIQSLDWELPYAGMQPKKGRKEGRREGGKEGRREGRKIVFIDIQVALEPYLPKCAPRNISLSRCFIENKKGVCGVGGCQ